MARKQRAEQWDRWTTMSGLIGNRFQIRAEVTLLSRRSVQVVMSCGSWAPANSFSSGQPATLPTACAPCTHPGRAPGTIQRSANMSERTCRRSSTASSRSPAAMRPETSSDVNCCPGVTNTFSRPDQEENPVHAKATLHALADEILKYRRALRLLATAIGWADAGATFCADRPRSSLASETYHQWCAAPA